MRGPEIQLRKPKVIYLSTASCKLSSFSGNQSVGVNQDAGSPPVSKTGKEPKDLDDVTEAVHPVLQEASFAKAISTAQELLTTIEATFPLRSEPHTWRSKVRWVMKDKQLLARLKEQLKSTESTLQGIVTMEQLRVSHMIHVMLLQQQNTLDQIGREGISTKNLISMATINQCLPQSTLSILEAQPPEIKQTTKQSAPVITKPTKSLPWILRFDRKGFSAQILAVPKDKGNRYQAAVHMSLLGKIYSVQLQMSYPEFSFDRMLHVRNIVPNDSAMTVACRTGDFNGARKLLSSGAAHGNDTTLAGWPMLDREKYAIESGSARLVRLLLEYGAHPDMIYGEHNMTALQSSFLRGHLDIARILLNRRADIEHVDGDGYSVLSYLWVVDSPLVTSVDFMRLCLSNEFSEVNACDSRGWSAFQRAAAIGTPEDVDAFLKLGASLDLRAEWYGWTALFFAASHDNVETFKTILTHPAPLPEDPELSYRELTPSDIALYIGPNRCQMSMDALADTGRDVDLEGTQDMFWETAADTLHEDSEGGEKLRQIYGAEDVDVDRWTLLHWASYNGSSKVKKLLLLKGVDPEHQHAIELEDSPTILAKSPFEGR
ncbi:MAG: hypothetical protein Q9226_007744 [Calogaya cf. arnoldii]